MEYSGYESAFVPTPSSTSNSAEVDRKTSDTTKPDTSTKTKEEEKQLYKFSGQKNVLNRYRSYTYNFTLAALKNDQLNDPEVYRKSELDYVILKSGGKGTTGFSNKGVKVDINDQVLDARDARVKADNEKKAVSEISNLINGFNNESPGKFDMFIDSVEIETIMSFTNQGGTTLPTRISFEIIEPYSINGFIEALHVSAVAAGYPSYNTASYILKIDFIGYPDNDLDEFTDPKIIERSSRYFIIGFTGLEVEVTERGTKYRCSAVPFNEKGFGNPGVLKKPIKMTGNTIKSILDDLMKNITDQQKYMDDKSREKSTNHDTYEIKFKKLDEKNEWIDDDSGKIASAKLVEIGKENTIYKMEDPSNTSKQNAYKADKAAPSSPDKQKSSETIKYQPGSSVIQFPEKANIHEIIAAVIRDSEYVRNILKQVGTGTGVPDENGMIEYFSIRLEVKNKLEIDPETKKPYQTFIYIVSPYKVHYTAIPNFESQKIDEKKLKRLTVREYNYIYTGQNVDIINFKLNFNNLYFEAIPAALGNKDTPGIKTAAKQGNTPEIKSRNQESQSSENLQVPDPSKRVDPDATSVRPPSGYNAGLPLNDPYSVLAKSIHEKLINSVSLLTGEIEIIGDPVYLVTGGIGNYNPKQETDTVTEDGEVAHLRGQVLISLNFRNPIDINSFENGGMMRFDSNRVPFSGVYMVRTVKNNFKNGNFTQNIDIIRVPGQLIDVNLEPSDPADSLILNPNPQDKVVQDTSFAVPSGERVNDSSVNDVLGRSLPNPGLPGEQVNYTSGGLGVDDSSLQNQTLGLSNNQINSANSSLIPLESISSNIRLSSSGLSLLGQFGLENVSKIKTTIGILGNGLGKSDANFLANEISQISIKNSLIPAVKGSGIGTGPTVFLNEQNALSSDSVSYTSGPVEDLSNNKLNQLTGYNPTLSNNLVGGIGEKTRSIFSSNQDPLGRASLTGLNPGEISGVSNFQSKSLNELNKFSESNVNVNLYQEQVEGLILNQISADKLKNIPASQPYNVAPNPDINTSYINQVSAAGGAASVARLYGANSLSQVSSNSLPKNLKTDLMSYVPPGQINPLSNFSTMNNKSGNEVNMDKNLSAQQLLNNNFIRDQNYQTSVVGIFGSKTLGKSPLDKLMNQTMPYTNNETIRKNLG